MGQVQVFGLGASGLAAAQLLSLQHSQVIVCDERNNPTVQQHKEKLEQAGIAVSIDRPFEVWPETQQVAISPGIDWHLPVLVEARARGVETLGEAELAWRSLQQVPWIGITGTNGKTTTTALVEAIFKAAGWHAPACGNIGLPLCQVAFDALTSQTYPDWIVAELSSYQVEASSTLAPDIAIWTTLTPDHLARHRTLERYIDIKASLIRRAKTAILNDDDSYLHSQRSQWPQALWTSCNSGFGDARICVDATGKAWVWWQKEPILPLSEFHLLGDHNRQNLLMAIAAACRAGVPSDRIREAIRTFPGLPHRLELVRAIDSIQFVNDSKATNYDAAEVGLAAVAAPVVLIAGGQPKTGDDRAWLRAIQAKVAAVILIGEAAEPFAARLADVGYTDFQIVETLAEAVPLAFDRARAIANALEMPSQGKPRSPLVTVLLSPACASFDQYPNFARRGEHFKQCCDRLVG
ncbi:UDP-N-acetylmuramoyl-L-alanine--D-glutamate ligase [Synechococcus sp. PCC 7336]|uniref:UDP-N-acetylmuramoyl-L-alanine--D-glutamate ligase n=1 Tax=Synechococcus sp. PCC 7336 TaxID=195250 RepID=UPI000476C27B|nr:UDP-N-acetylmuramoyl-L-alanine--D-glutamate ligase [Synechococcus sp. PCC 7336]